MIKDQIWEMDDASVASSARLPDLERPLLCLFGLVFDNVDAAEALEVVRSAVRSRRRCVISTPNLNFVVRSVRDRRFRGSVIRGDLSLVDGMPLVWAGRLLGLGIKARVTGAGLFEDLRRECGLDEPLKVYLFGGPPGIARIASERLNAEAGGVRCVGYHMPGFGSIAEMSGPDIIREINASGADFVLVALGAEKGLGWIEHNQNALDAPIISHLGAVINFTAGTVRRAPPWIQNAGLEWVWRISREPLLWRRYLGDGLQAARLAGQIAVALLLASITKPRSGWSALPDLIVTEDETSVVVTFKGIWNSSSLVRLRAILKSYSCTPKQLCVDFRYTEDLDSSTAALILICKRYRIDTGLPWKSTGVSFNLARRLEIFGGGDVAS